MGRRVAPGAPDRLVEAPAGRRPLAGRQFRQDRHHRLLFGDRVPRDPMTFVSAEPASTPVAPEGHDALLARGRRLELLTIGWNVMEVFVTVGLGVAAGSLALIAFGLDSLVEVFASVVVIWYIGNHHAEGRARNAL